jgi:hypothetical protein
MKVRMNVKHHIFIVSETNLYCDSNALLLNSFEKITSLTLFFLIVVFATLWHLSEKERF